MSNPWPTAASVDPIAAKFAHISDTELVDFWRNSKLRLDYEKAIEMEWRKAVAMRFFPNPEKGTQRHELTGPAQGYTLKLVHKLDYKLPPQKENEKIDAVEDAICKTGNEGAFIVDRLIKWSAELSVSEYNTLCENAEKGSGDAIAIKKLIDSILTVKPASPTLELEPPKSK